jgi:actin-like ATPase involved in cell morphogenesis
MSYRLGIDLGTTYTAAAVTRPGTDGRRPTAEIVNLGDRAAQIPSVLHLSPDGTVLVGEAAERRVVSEPDRVVREFKRQVGDLTPIVVDGVEHTAHDLMALLVGRVVDQVVQRQGGRPDRIAVTHPAAWGPHKVNLIRTALQARGLEVELLDEPRAAALSYAATERVAPGSVVAVYDLGGGTFDAAVVRKNGGFTMLGRPDGIERLGGVDFDDAVFTHVRSSVGKALDQLDPADEEVVAAVARLRRDCVEAKEALSSDTEVRIPVLLPGLRTTVRLVRGEFEEMIRDDVAASVEVLRQAVTSAGVEPADLTTVLLVGGSSRIPLVAQLVSAGLDRPVAVDADPKNAIALGAALAVSPGPDQARPAAARSIPRPGAVAATGVIPRPSAPPPAPVPAGVTGAPRAAAVAMPPAGRLAAGRPMISPAAGERPTRTPGGHSVLPAPRQPVDGPAPTAVLGTAAGPGRPPAAGDRRSRRPVGVYLGAGGLLVAAALAAVSFWPDQPVAAPTGSSISTLLPVSAAADPAPTSAPAPAEDDEPVGAAGPVRSPAGDGNAPRAREEQVVVVTTTTAAPPTSATPTEPPTTTTAEEPSTAPPEPEVTVPPIDPGPGG